MRRVAFIALALSAAVLGGCSDSCRQLAEKLCQCQEKSVEEVACKQQVAEEEGRQHVTEQDQNVCASLLPGCDCHTIQTPEGKRACGLAR